MKIDGFPTIEISKKHITSSIDLSEIDFTLAINEIDEYIKLELIAEKGNEKIFECEFDKAINEKIIVDDLNISVLLLYKIFKEFGHSCMIMGVTIYVVINHAIQNNQFELIINKNKISLKINDFVTSISDFEIFK